MQVKLVQFYRNSTCNSKQTITQSLFLLTGRTVSRTSVGSPAFHVVFKLLFAKLNKPTEHLFYPGTTVSTSTLFLFFKKIRKPSFSYSVSIERLLIIFRLLTKGGNNNSLNKGIWFYCSLFHVHGSRFYLLSFLALKCILSNIVSINGCRQILNLYVIVFLYS